MFTDGFSKVHGKHTLKFGGEFRYLQINERNTCAPNGDFTFDGSVTGVDFADYLIGAPAYGGFNQCSQQFLDSRTRYGGAYAQDSWKLKPNLTLNLGRPLGSEHAVVRHPGEDRNNCPWPAIHAVSDCAERVGGAG